MGTIIKVENLGKKYLIRHQQRERYVALRDVLTNKFKSIGKKVLQPMSHEFRAKSSSKEDFWALKDISFEINEGDRIGIIGRNGAGKTTLLKLLSRITEPTTGRITLRGRVASLLEVGTGFHPELTGRENIFLNGAILGMSKVEIKKKFDEIVSFAEVKKFIDTPVKRYSTGMYLRLAFAVAAHLEPEILIVDEVLAVGDAQFQKKCLGKMEEVGKKGRTILFVSHNMAAIRQLCSRALLLDSGNVVMDASPDLVIGRYLTGISQLKGHQDNLDAIIKNLPQDPDFKLEKIILSQEDKMVSGFVKNGQPLCIEIQYRVLRKTTGMRVYFDLCDDEDLLLFRSFHDEDSDGIPTMLPGCYVSRTFIPADLLAPANYQLRIRSGIYNVRYCMPEPGITIPLFVEHTGKYNRAYIGDPIQGKLAPAIGWETISERQD